MLLSITSIRSALSRILQGNASRTALASYFAFFSAAACGLISIPIAVTYLAKPEIGLWAVVNAIIGYLLWMDLGVGEATGRKMADAVASSDQNEINSWWTTTRLVLVIQGFLVACVGLSLLKPFLSFFEVPKWQETQATLLYCGCVVIASLSMPLRGVPGLMVAQKRAYWTGLWQGVSPWINLITFYAFLAAGYGLIAYLIAMLITQGATWLCYAGLVRSGPLIPKLDFTKITRVRIASLFRYSLSLSFMSIIDGFTATLPTLILGKYGGLSLIPIYTFTSKCPLLLTSLVNRTIWASYPGILRDHVDGNTASIPAKHQFITLVVASIGLFVAGGVMAFNESLVVLLAGPDFYAGHFINSMFVAAILVEPACHMFRFLLHLGGSMGKAALIALGNLLLGGILAVISYKTLGMSGLAAVGILIPVSLAIYGLIHGAKVCRFPKGSISRLGPALTLALVTFILLAGYILEHSPQVTSTLTIHNRIFMFPQIGNIYAGGVMWIGAAILSVFACKIRPRH
jgi:O-antigen/teichoic acid export membrane protein